MKTVVETKTKAGERTQIIKDPTAEQAAKLLGVPVEGVRRVYSANANHLFVMASQAAIRLSKTFRGFSETYLRDRAASYQSRCAS
jgi:hypothetical protein